MILPNPHIPRARSLAGKSVFLSASVPSRERSENYRRVADAAVSIEEAVIAVARAVFSAGGELVFGAHPSISPLVASVLGEYRAPQTRQTDFQGEPNERGERQNQPRVVMYQSEVWKPFWAESSERLAEHPLVETRWTDVVDHEAVSLDRSDVPQAPHSMKRMRERMIQEARPVAMIAIGGMEGTEAEVDLFAQLREGFPIYLLATTGGAAGLLSMRRQLSQSRVIVIDEKARDDVERFWREQEQGDPRRARDQGAAEGSAPRALREERYYVPYTLVAQQILAEIGERQG